MNQTSSQSHLMSYTECLERIYLRPKCPKPTHRKLKRLKLKHLKAKRLKIEYVKSEPLNSECLESFLANPYDVEYIASKMEGLKGEPSFDDVINVLVGYLSHSPRFYDETGEFPPFSEEEAMKILKPNLFCAVLADDRFGPKTYSLGEVINKTDAGVLSPSQASRHPLKNYPSAFRSVFGIEKEKNSYKIKTSFLPLLRVILNHQAKLPYWSTGKPRAANWNQNITLLNACLDVIFPPNEFSKNPHTIPDDIGNADRFVMYYYMERLFRIETKIRLFFAYDALEKQMKDSKFVLSPSALAYFFFSSPLVYIPDEYISKCLYSETCFHMLFQLSFYWFPVMYYGLDLYFSLQELADPADIKNFFLWSTPNRQNFYKMCIISHWDDDTLTRGGRLDAYNNEWKEFKPPYGYDSCYAFQPIDNWKAMRLPKNFSDHDRQVFKKIQRILR